MISKEYSFIGYVLVQKLSKQGNFLKYYYTYSLLLKNRMLLLSIYFAKNRRHNNQNNYQDCY